MKAIASIFFVLILTTSASFASDRDIVWGAPVGGVKVGVTQWPRWSSRNGLIVIDIAKETTLTNILVVPKDFNQRFECLLRGTNSLPVKKTKEGQKYGIKLEASVRHWKQKNFRWYEEGNLGSDPEQLAFFEIDKTFIIKHQGVYELEIRPRLLKQTTNGLVPVVFDPIKIKLHLAPNANN